MFLRLLLKVLGRLVEPGRLHRTEQFATVPRADADVLFVGDSITEFGLWSEWFPDLVTINRGIAGNTSAQVVDRLDTLPTTARHVFLLIGTNDLSLGVREDVIVANVEKIVRHLRASYPAATVTVQSVMPRRKAWTTRLRALNVRLQSVARENGAAYLDLWPVLADENDELARSLSRDGLHLNGDGYEKWVEVLRPLVAA